MLKIAILAAGAAVVLAGPAAAQVAGGLGGQVGGSVGVGVPQTAPMTDQLGRTMNDARDMTRDTVRDGRDIVRDARPDVSANANVNARANADSDGARLDAALRTGVAVQSSDGVSLGSVVDVTRNSVGRATHVLVRSADGAVRSIPTGGLSVRGDAVVSGWTESQFRSHRAR